MSQSGLHGLIGSYGARLWPASRDAEAGKVRGAAIFGFVLGNIIPDVDFFALGATFLFNSGLARTMHRSFTHSLITIALITLVAYWLAKSKTGRALAMGLGAGMLCHTACDIVTWFSGVDLLWPLSLFGLPSKVNLWASVKNPVVINNLLGAADYLCFGLFYAYLRSVARASGTDAGFLPRLKRFIWLQWAFTAIYTVLAFTISGGLFEIAHYAMFILVFFPIALHVTLKMRATIETLAEKPGIAA